MKQRYAFEACPCTMEVVLDPRDGRPASWVVVG